MSIVDAIQKAKRMQQERAEAIAPPTRNKPAIRVPRVERRMGTEADLPPVPRLEFPALALDPAVCAQNLILLTRDAAQHGYSAAVDSYRILRTRLTQRGGGAQTWNSFGICSAGPGEGKTVTCINLAMAYAREKKRNVFLLDLDLRNPSICRYLGVAPTVDIGQALTQEAKPEQLFFSVGIENLFVAGGLTSHENSSELLGSAALGEIFEFIHRSDPDALILVDLPPLLVCADAQVVAPRLSAIVLVVAEGVTRRDQVKPTLDLLAGVTVAGIFLNRSRDSVEDYYS